MTAVVLDQVSKSFGSHRAVEDLSLRVPTGSIYGFIGPNGSGKTTTLRMIMRILHPDKGSIQVLGESSYGAANDRIGYLPENPPLYNEMTVDSYLDFVARIKGVDAGDRKKRIGEVKEKVSIQEYSRTLIKNLSQGYKQRVGLAPGALAR